MYRLETHIDIHTSPERVWSVLTDLPSHPRWNPFIRSIEGTLVAGRKILVVLQPPGGKAMRIRPTVLAAEPNREFRWKGRLFLPGLFDGEHYFLIKSTPEGKVAFVQGEVFSGVLVPLFRRFLDGAVRDGFIAMNKALKGEAEKP